MNTYYPQIQSVLNDTRFHLIIDDAKAFIKNTNMKYDMVINDCFNLTSSFSEQDRSIFELLETLLTDNGVCSDLIYRHIFDEKNLRKTIELLINKHKTVLSLVVVPEYPGIMHLLSIWGNSNFLNQNLTGSVNEFHIECIQKKIEFTKLFNPVYISYYLYIPPYIRDIFRESA
jgi:spermidine synthase